MRNRLTIILILLIVFSAENFAERRYVSKTGTSTPPTQVGKQQQTVS